jgi:AAA domain, putative AbiEii toxin, Type IV TA system
MFNLTFRNLGPVHEAKLKLRPLTVIIGSNNTGKTYLAYATYALFKEALPGVLFRAVTFSGTEPSAKSFAVYGSEIVRSLQRTVRLSPASLTEVFQDTSGQLFREVRASIEVLDLDADKIVNIAEKEWHGKELEERNNYALRARLSVAFEAALQGVLLRPLLLPAERNAFVITYKMLANRRYRMLREGVRGLGGARVDQRQFLLLREQGDIRYPTPIEDFLDFLTDAELSPKGVTSGSAVQKLDMKLGLLGLPLPSEPLTGTLKSSKFERLASQLEQGVQGGLELFYHPTELGGRELRVRLDEKRSLDLYNASSSIKQLAPLLLYLRHRSAEGDLLVIDEPEMNLHPEGQARLLEVLAMLANLGVYVLVTTHSPYILAHLNNLTASTTKLMSVRLRQAEHLYLRDRRAFLRSDQVSAYEAGNGTLRDLHDADFGIRWDTLSDVSTELQQKYFAIREEEGGKGRGRAKKKA